MKNILSNWIGMVINLLVSLFMMPFVIHELGTIAYGFWALLQAVISYMFLLDFGVRSSLNRYLAKFYAQGAYEEVNRILNTGLSVYLLVSIVVVVFSYIFGITFHWFFSFPELHPTTVFWSVILIGSSVALRFPTAVFDAVLTALQRYDLSNLAQITNLFARTVLIIFSLKAGYGLLAISAATFLGNVLNLVLNYLLATWLCPTLCLNLSLRGRGTLRLLANHSLYAYILLGASRIITDGGIVIVGAFVGSAAVAFYAVAGSLINYATGIVSGISTTIPPVASYLEARSDDKGLQILCIRTSKSILLVGFPVLLTFILSGDIFLRLWIGAEFEVSYLPIVLLSVGWMTNYVQAAAACILIGLSRHRVAAWLVLAQAILNVSLSILLVQIMGMIGVALGALIASVIMNLVFQIHALRLLNIALKRFVVQVLIPTFFSMIPFTVVLKLLIASHPPAHLLTYFAYVALAVSSMFICLPWLGLNRNERSEVWRNAVHWKQIMSLPTP